MKKLLVVGIIFSFYCISYSQDTIKGKNIYSMDDFITIKIRSGYTILGTESITLQREGLIYWTNPFLADHLSEENKKEKAKFVPFTELDISKVFEIIRYIHENKLYEMESQPRTHSYYDSTKHTDVQIIYPTGRPIVLTFIVHDKFRYTGFNYRICDERVDTLIKMMNELIPEEDREKFGIRLKCN